MNKICSVWCIPFSTEFGVVNDVAFELTKFRLNSQKMKIDASIVLVQSLSFNMNMQT